MGAAAAPVVGRVRHLWGQTLLFITPGIVGPRSCGCRGVNHMSKKRHQQRRHRKKSAWRPVVFRLVVTCGLSSFRLYQRAVAFWEMIKSLLGLE